MFEKVFKLILLALFLYGCAEPVDVALKTRNIKKGKAAVEQITDQALLAKVASSASETDVRIAAIRKLTDQSTLAKIAMEDDSYFISQAAIGNLTDQPTLEKIALGRKSSFLRGEAINKLTNPKILEKIAMEDEDSNVRMSTINKLTNPEILAKIAMQEEKLNIRKRAINKLAKQDMLEKLAAINGDSSTNPIYKLLQAFDKVPDEHRLRLINRLLPVVIALSDTEVVNITGEVVSIDVQWLSRSKQYLGGMGSKRVPGELFKCSIKLKNLTKPSSHVWVTEFKRSVTTTRTKATTLAFNPADIKTEDLLVSVFEQLSQSDLNKFALESLNFLTRKAAINNLTIQPTLKKIALDGSESDSIRKTAIENLTDQPTLEKIALDSAVHYTVRKAAVIKLTAKSTLENIAKDSTLDKDNVIRIAARQRLDDLSKAGK